VVFKVRDYNSIGASAKNGSEFLLNRFALVFLILFRPPPRLAISILAMYY
jgi:hypothetical protein